MDKLVGGAPKPDARMPYESPRLDVYGDLSRITAAVGNTGSMDGAPSGATKTRP